jgi:hypothetical protein
MGPGRRGRRAGAAGVLLPAAAATPALSPRRPGLETPYRVIPTLGSPEWLVSLAGLPGGILRV